MTLGPFFKLRFRLPHLRAIVGGGIVLYAVLVSFNWFHGYARQNGGLVGVQGMLRPSDHYYPHLVCFTFHTPVLFETTTHLHRIREIGTVRPEGDFTRRILPREEIEREEADFLGRVVPRDLPGQLQRYCDVSKWTAELAISLWKPHLEDRQRTVRLVGLGVPMLAASAEEPVWPLRRFYMDSLGPVPIVDGPKPAWNDCPDSPSHRVLAWRPVWMTFLPAWAIVSLAWLGIENGFACAFVAMRKRVREQRGQCYGCGYPIATGRDAASASQLTRCPECGNQLSARWQTPPPPWWLRRRLWTGVAMMLARVIGAGAALYGTTWLCNFLPAQRQRPEVIAVHDAGDRVDSEYVVGLMAVYGANVRASAMVQLHFNSAKYLGDRMRPIWLSELPVACEQLPGALPGEPTLWLELQNPSKLVRWMTILGWPVPMLSGVSSDFTGAKVVGVVDLPRSQTIPGAPTPGK